MAGEIAMPVLMHRRMLRDGGSDDVGTWLARLFTEIFNLRATTLDLTTNRWLSGDHRTPRR
jgi:hypothetical protein